MGLTKRGFMRYFAPFSALLLLLGTAAATSAQTQPPVNQRPQETRPSVATPAPASSAKPAQPVATAPATQPAQTAALAAEQDSAKKAEEPKKDEQAKKEPESLMVIRYQGNQNYNNFEPAMRRAVKASENKASGTMYEVVSYVPMGDGKTPARRTRHQERVDTRLNDVLTQLRQNGIDASRIIVRTQPVPEGNTQEIKIFVRDASEMQGPN